MTFDPATCPPARVRVPHYIGANTVPGGRVCVWDGCAQVYVDGDRRGLQGRVEAAVRELDAARAAKVNA